MMDERLRPLRLAGLSGILGGIVWTLADFVVIGHPISVAEAMRRGPYGLLVGIPADRLALGAALATYAAVLLSIGSYHFYRAIAPWRRWAAIAIALAHVVAWILGAAFHLLFAPIGVVRNLSSVTPVAAPALAEVERVAAQASSILAVALYPTLMLGGLFLLVVVALGKSRYPRWFALLTVLPLSVVAWTGFVPNIPAPAGGFIYAAWNGLTFVITFTASTVLLWNGGTARAPSDG